MGNAIFGFTIALAFALNASVAPLKWLQAADWVFAVLYAIAGAAAGITRGR